ncbi:MAG: hypothetical protein IPM14_16840 [bacterium]|nr:hypothetical protein [bacterium]
MSKYIIRLKLIVCFSAIVLHNSCDYSPTETNFKTVNPPEGTVDITVLNPDAINQIRGTITFAVETELNGHTVKFVTGFLDEMEVSLHMSGSSQIVFNSEYYQDGDYTFTLLLAATTNTGSLADRLGAEALIAAKQYPVTIFNGPISTPQLKEFTIENGSLTLNWEKYEQPFFKLYIIKRNGSTIAAISNVNQTKYYDTTYFTGYGYYELVTQVMNIYKESETKVFQSISPSFVSTIVMPDEKLLVTWNKFPLTAAFRNYKIVSAGNEIEIFSPYDTVLVDESPALGRPFYRLSAFSKAGEETPSVSIHGQSIGTPFPFGEGAWLKYIPEKNLFVMLDYSHVTYQHSISTYDGTTLNLINSRVFDFSIDGINLTISDNGDYMYYTYDRSVYKINVSTLNTEAETDIIALMPTGNYRTYAPIQSIKINNDNKLSVIIIKSNGLQVLAYFNMNTNQCFFTYSFNFGLYYTELRITNDQQYVAFNNRIYRYTGSSLIEIGSIPTYNAVFTKDNSRIIIVSQNNSIQIYRTSDVQLLLEIPGEFYYYPLIDSNSGLLAANGYIFDPITGQQRGHINVSGLTHFYLNGLYFVDGYYKYVELN